MLLNLVEVVAENYHKGDYSKIFIGGFSSGACLSLLIGLSLKNTVGGILMCSGIVFPGVIGRYLQEEDKCE